MKALRALLVAVVLALLLPAAAAPAMAAPPTTVAAAVLASVPERLPTDIAWRDVASASKPKDPCALLKGTPGYDYCTRDHDKGSGGGGASCNADLTPTLGLSESITGCVAAKIVGPQAKKAVSDALQSTVVNPMADGMREFVTQILKTGLTWWLTTPSIQVKDSGVTDSQTGKLSDGSTVTFSLQAIMLGIGEMIAILLLITQGVRAMIQRKGKPLADAAQGLIINVLVCVLGITVIDSLLVASDQLTEAIINVAFHGDAKLTERVVAMLLPMGFNPMGLLVMACIIFLVSGVQFILNFLRQAAIPIQALLLPIAGAGQIGGEKTKQWLPRIYTSIGVVIVYKPAAALIISAGFVEVANGTGLVDWFRGLVTLVLSVFALKYLMALFAPLGASMASATSGGFSGALAGAGGLIGMMSGGGKGDGGGSSTSAVQHAQSMDRSGTPAPHKSIPQSNPYSAPVEMGIAAKDKAGGTMSGQDGSGIPQQQGGPGKQSGGGLDGQGQDGGSAPVGAGASGGGGSSAGAPNNSTGGNVTIAVRAAEAGSNRPGPGQNNGGQ